MKALSSLIKLGLVLNIWGMSTLISLKCNWVMEIMLISISVACTSW